MNSCTVRKIYINTYIYRNRSIHPYTHTRVHSIQVTVSPSKLKSMKSEDYHTVDEDDDGIDGAKRQSVDLDRSHNESHTMG
jgi:hypothetical protein